MNSIDLIPYPRSMMNSDVIIDSTSLKTSIFQSGLVT